MWEEVTALRLPAECVIERSHENLSLRDLAAVLGLTLSIPALLQKSQIEPLAA